MAVTGRIHTSFCLNQNELRLLIKSLRLPLLRAQVLVLFVASTSSYAHESPFTSGHCIEYACGTVDIKFGKIQCHISPVLQPINIKILIMFISIIAFRSNVHFLPTTATYIFTDASSASDCYHQDHLPHYLIKYSVKQGENTSDVYGTN